MIKKIIVVILVIVTSISYAQEGTSSPYSFYGIGLKKFKGTIENMSMGGLSILSDSIHINLQNPAAYGKLGLTTYTIGATYNNITLNNEDAKSYTDNATLDYLAIGIPAGKFGFGLGVIPLTSVGYRLSTVEQDGSERSFTGRGGVNKVFVAAGVKVNENLSLGLDFNYNFGNIENITVVRNTGIQFDTREINSSNLSGVSLSFGLNYTTNISDKLRLSASVVSTPSFKLSSDNSGELASVSIGTNGTQIINRQELNVEDRNLDLPAEVKFGGGIGQPKNWFVGAEYVYKGTADFTDRAFTLDNVSYQNASEFKVGGYYVPKYNSLTSYFKRVVFRAGFRYEETGLYIGGQSIDEFGISFGVGLPVGNLFSNTNIGIEYGQRGKTDFGLVREDFLNFSISLSLNDRWFRKLKFN